MNHTSRRARGRPSLPFRYKTVAAALPENVVAALDDLARKQNLPSRSEALRLFVREDAVREYTDLLMWKKQYELGQD